MKGDTSLFSIGSKLLDTEEVLSSINVVDKVVVDTVRGEVTVGIESTQEDRDESTRSILPDNENISIPRAVMMLPIILKNISDNYGD